MEVGIPDLGLEDATMELIQEYLPPELAERFPELPVGIFQEDFSTIHERTRTIPRRNSAGGWFGVLQIYYRYLVAGGGQELVK